MRPFHLLVGRCRGLPLVALLTAAPLAQAQQPPATPVRTERADPLDAQARVPAVRHVSALAHYRPLGDDQRLDWKQANEAVNRIGGWRAYAREAQQPEAVPPTAPAPANRTAPAPMPAATPASGAKPAHAGHPRH